MLSSGDERFAQLLFRALEARGNDSLKVIDRAQSRAAARGAGYDNSLNLTLDEARDLGAALGCDFYLLGDAGVLRRSASTRPVYYEAYATIFVVSSRSGRLISWDRASFDAETPAAAEVMLAAELPRRAAGRLREVILRAAEDEPIERAAELRRDALLIENVPEEETSAAEFRPPQPYRRLRPTYTEAAARADVAATIDVVAEIDVGGAVRSVTVTRWGGFGLDEEVAATVRRMHFRPAMREGAPVPIKALLRYNFRPPPRSGSAR